MQFRNARRFRGLTTLHAKVRAGTVWTAVSGAIAIWFAAWLLLGDATAATRWGGYAMPWLGLAALIAALENIGRSRYLVAGQFLLAAVMLYPLAVRFWPARLTDHAAASDLRVVTYNITDFNAATLPQTYDRAAESISRVRPDIVFLQQIADPKLLLRSFARNPSLRGLHALAIPPSQDFILSRYPLERMTGPIFRSAAAVADVRQCRLRLWDLHAPHGEWDFTPQERFFADYRGRFAGKMTITAGDMNSTEFNSVQGPIRDVMEDAFARVGFGSGFSYPTRVRHLGALGALVRIDHIFYTPPLIPTESFAFAGDAGSDHYAVFAAFRLPAKCAKLVHSRVWGEAKKGPVARGMPPRAI